MKIPAWLHPIAVALALATLLSPTVWAASASSGRPQKLTSPDAVPEGLSASEWSGIRQQYEQHRHATFPVAGGYQARNPGQQWQTRFDGRGFTVTSEPGRAAVPRRPLTSSLATPLTGDQGRAAAQPYPSEEGWQWGLELQSYGFAGSERTVSNNPRVNTAGERVIYDWDATLQEWFVNDRRGLEHGFTVRERPTDRRAELHEAQTSDGDSRSSSLQSAPSLNSQPSTLNFLLDVRGGLRPEVQADGRGVRFIDAQGAAALTYSELTVLDADGRKLPARFEPVAEGLRFAVHERGARYPLTIDPIAQQAYLKASNIGGEFGISVAVAGDTVVVGAWNESSSATGVDGDQSDTSAPSAGAAYVFVRNGTNWTQQAYLKASNTEADDVFGWSVAISGDTVVVGAYGEDSRTTGVDGDGSDNSALAAGAAYIFVRNGTNWTQQAYLKASNTEAGDNFGWSVAATGDTVVIGAPGESSATIGLNGNQSDNSVPNSGALYIFVRTGATWTQQAYLKASNTGAKLLSGDFYADNFGYSVAVSGDTVVVGSYGEDSNASGVNGNQNDNSAPDSGAAYVFVRAGTAWTQQAYLKASNTEAGDAFGFSVAVSGETAVVGAYVESSHATEVNGDQSDNSAIASGAAYVFVRGGTNWTQQAYLKASNSEAYDYFGRSVAVSGDTVVVAAQQESSSARGVNGNQSDNSAGNAGAAYVFVRNGTNWSQQAYLKASNPGVNDFFGWSVSVSGETVVVGAYEEASNATGVDGDQSDNSAGYSGAAYVFTGLGHGPSLGLAPDGSGGYFIRFTGAPDVTYRLQRAPAVTGPWSTLVTNTAPASGLIEYHETTPPPSAAFYRTAEP